jgi:oligopeptide transport system substrate-binding protein
MQNQPFMNRLPLPTRIAPAITHLLICLSSILLLACSPGESRVEQGNRLSEFHASNNAEPQTLDPQIHTGVPENNISMGLFEGLVSADPHDLSPAPGMAERWEISEDGLTYRFYLRPDAKWSDGTPITAEDYHWSWQRALHPKMGNEYAYMMFPIKNAEPFGTGKLDDYSQVGVRVIDDRTLEVELENPTPYFLQLLDHHSYFAVPKHVVLKYGEMTDRYSDWTRPGNMVSNGPFRLAEWKIYHYVKLEKNPHYWDADKVALNAIYFYPVENYSTEERMFRVGQVHKTFEIPLDKFPDYQKNHPELLRNQPYLGTYYYQFNLTRKPFDDVRVRRAMALAIDREAVVQQVMYGVVDAAYTLTPPGAAGYQPPVLLKFDPEEAKRLLAEAGYPDGKGFPAVELLYNTNESHRKIAVAVQQMWKKHLNIDITLTNQEWKVYIDSRNRLQYDMARAGWIGDVVDPMNFLDLGLSTNGNNRSGYNRPEYDDYILNKIPSSKTKAERFENFYQAESIIMEDLPFVPVYTYKTKYLVNPTVKGLHSNYLDKYYWKYVSVGN